MTTGMSIRIVVSLSPYVFLSESVMVKTANIWQSKKSSTWFQKVLITHRCTIPLKKVLRDCITKLVIDPLHDPIFAILCK